MHYSKRLLSILSSAALVLSLSACGSSSAAEPAASSAPEVQTLTGTAPGKNGDVTVEVTLEGNKITAGRTR